MFFEEQIKERFRRRSRGPATYLTPRKRTKKNPHVDLPLGMIWPKREDEDNSIAIDIEATVTRIIVVYKRLFFN